MKLSHIRDVIAVAECGSLRAAGRHLNLAQPAITRSIHEIESELGVSLFERHAKGVRPTAMGEAFLRRARAIDAEVIRAQEEIEQLKGRTVGQVAVALSSASIISLAPNAIKTFRKRYPDSLIKVTEGMFQAVESELLDGQLDLYAGPFDPEVSSTHLMVEKLFDNRRVVACRSGHPLQNVRRLRELTDASWIRPTLSTRLSEADFDTMFERYDLPAPKIVLHTKSALLMLVTVANSDLLTILPEQWLETPLFGEQISALQLEEIMPAAPICIVRRHDMPLTPMAEHFCDLLRRGAGHYISRRQRTAT